jgi:hypothetical protein
MGLGLGMATDTLGSSPRRIHRLELAYFQWRLRLRMRFTLKQEDGRPSKMIGVSTDESSVERNK